MITLFAISKTKLLILTKNTVIFHKHCRSRTSDKFLANPQCETRLNMIPFESSSDGQGWRPDWCVASCIVKTPSSFFLSFVLMFSFASDLYFFVLSCS